MSIIWKYDLTFDSYQKILIPKGAKILSVQDQYNMPKLWIECDPAEEKETKAIRIYNTGEECENIGGTYIGTILFCDGELVKHIYLED